MVVGEYAVDDDADGADDGDADVRDADVDWIFQEDGLNLICLILDFFNFEFQMKMILDLSLLPLFSSQVILPDCHNQAFLDSRQ